MKTFTLKFFARLREETGVDEMQIDVDQVQQLSDVKPYLIAQHPQWQSYLERNLMTAVNQQMTTDDIELKEGDEVALFPPVTGG